MRHNTNFIIFTAFTLQLAFWFFWVFLLLVTSTGWSEVTDTALKITFIHFPVPYLPGSTAFSRISRPQFFSPSNREEIFKKLFCDLFTFFSLQKNPNKLARKFKLCYLQDVDEDEVEEAISDDCRMEMMVQV